VGGLSLLVVIIGMVAYNVSLALDVINPDAEAAFGDTVTFEAQAGRYDLLVSRNSLLDVGRDRAVRTARCTVVLSSGDLVEINGARQAISEETSLVSSIGWFTATPGETTVTCTESSALAEGYTFAVARPQTAVKVLSWVGIGVGVIGILVAAYLIAIGLRGRIVVCDPS
jgi:hypothetical protein